jgi:lambda family phage minor tail protein L
VLPRRIITQNYCQWKYRSSECGYTGGAVAKVDDTPTSNLNEDVCGKRVSSCQLRFVNQSLPFGGFPGAIRGRQ